MLAPVPLREMTRRHRRPRTARDQRTPSGPGNPAGVIPVENDRSRGFQVPLPYRFRREYRGRSAEIFEFLRADSWPPALSSALSATNLRDYRDVFPDGGIEWVTTRRGSDAPVFGLPIGRSLPSRPGRSPSSPFRSTCTVRSPLL